MVVGLIKIIVKNNSINRDGGLEKNFQNGFYLK